MYYYYYYYYYDHYHYYISLVTPLTRVARNWNGKQY